MRIRIDTSHTSSNRHKNKENINRRKNIIFEFELEKWKNEIEDQIEKKR